MVVFILISFRPKTTVSITSTVHGPTVNQTPKISSNKPLLNWNDIVTVSAVILSVLLVIILEKISKTP